MNRSPRQQINKEASDLNYTLDQTDLIDMFRTFHPTAAVYAFFSSTRRMFFSIDHKTNLRRFKKIEITPRNVSNHNGMKQVNNRRTTGKLICMWKLNNTLLNNQCVKEEIKKEIKKNVSKQTKMETQHTKINWKQQKQFSERSL